MSDSVFIVNNPLTYRFHGYNKIKMVAKKLDMFLNEKLIFRFSLDSVFLLDGFAVVRAFK